MTMLVSGTRIWATYIRKYTGSVYCTDLIPNSTPTLLNVYVSSKANQNCVAQAKPRYTPPEQSKSPSMLESP